MARPDPRGHDRAWLQPAVVKDHRAFSGPTAAVSKTVFLVFTTEYAVGHTVLLLKAAPHPGGHFQLPGSISVSIPVSTCVC